MNVHPGRDGSSRGQDAVPPWGTDCAPGTPAPPSTDENDTVCTTPAGAPAACREEDGGTSPARDDNGFDVANPDNPSNEPEGNTTEDGEDAPEDTEESPDDDEESPDGEASDGETPEDGEASDDEGTGAAPSTGTATARPPSTATGDTAESAACAPDTRPAPMTAKTDTTATTGRTKRRQLNAFHTRIDVNPLPTHPLGPPIICISAGAFRHPHNGI